MTSRVLTGAVSDFDHITALPPAVTSLDVESPLLRFHSSDRPVPALPCPPTTFFIGVCVLHLSSESNPSPHVASFSGASPVAGLLTPTCSIVSGCLATAPTARAAHGREAWVEAKARPRSVLLQKIFSRTASAPR